MTAAAAVRSALRSSSSLRNAASKFTSTTRSAPPPSFRLPKPLSAPQILRSPTELSFCVESLLPMHSATASALMTSMLSVSRRDFGWLSEGDGGTLVRW